MKKNLNIIELGKSEFKFGRDREGSTRFFQAFRQKNHGDRTKYGKKDRRKNAVKNWE